MAGRKSPKQAREGRLATGLLLMSPAEAERKALEMEQKAGRKPKKRPMPQAADELYPGADTENFPYRLAGRKKRGGTYA